MNDWLAPVELLRESFQSAKPFPHLEFEQFLEPVQAKELAAAFPPADYMRRYGTSYETADEHSKMGLGTEHSFPSVFRELKQKLHSKEFLSWLSEVTGIDDLLANDAMVGGGLHMTMGDAGKLGAHIDFSELGGRLYRRLNLLLFLNSEWQPEFGGALELWDEDVQTCVHKLQPTLNRCVIFETSHKSWHGVETVRSPTPRRSFAVYYYTASPPPSYGGLISSTVFRKRPYER